MFNVRFFVSQKYSFDTGSSTDRNYIIINIFVHLHMCRLTSHCLFAFEIELSSLQRYQFSSFMYGLSFDSFNKSLF